MKSLALLLIAFLLVACAPNGRTSPPQPPLQSAPPSQQLPDPDPPVEHPGSEPPIEQPGTEPPLAGEGRQVEPTSGLIDPHPVAVDRFELSADGRTVRAYYWGGSDACSTLASAEVRPSADGAGYVVALSEGTRPEASRRACIAIAESKWVELEMPAHVLRDGSQFAAGTFGPSPVGAKTVEREDGLFKGRPTAIERFVLGPDGTSLRVYYWGGVDDCYGLSEVRIVASADGYEITVLEGDRLELLDFCIEMAQLKVYSTTLPVPVLRDAKAA